jgi:hypothetical protein
MVANTGDGEQPRAAVAARRITGGRGDRAQLAATVRWLRELRPVQREPVLRRPPSGTSS